MIFSVSVEKEHSFMSGSIWLSGYTVSGYTTYYCVIFPVSVEKEHRFMSGSIWLSGYTVSGYTTYYCVIFPVSVEKEHSFMSGSIWSYSIWLHNLLLCDIFCLNGERTQFYVR